MGEHDIFQDSPDDASEDYEVTKIIAHEDYVAKTFRNDIALIKLRRKVRAAVNIRLIVEGFYL